MGGRVGGMRLACRCGRPNNCKWEVGCINILCTTPRASPHPPSTISSMASSTRSRFSSTVFFSTAFLQTHEAKVTRCQQCSSSKQPAQGVQDNTHAPTWPAAAATAVQATWCCHSAPPPHPPEQQVDGLVKALQHAVQHHLQQQQDGRTSGKAQAALLCRRAPSRVLAAAT